MKLSKYRTGNLLKFAVIFSIIFGVANSISVQAQDPQTKPDSVEPSEPELSLKDIEKKIDGLIPELESFSDKIDESLNNQNYFSIKDSLIYIDLPIAVILLLLWFLNQNQRKKQIDRVIVKQDQIEKRLKELKQHNLTQNDIENIERKIVKQFQENNQKITDSKIEILGTLHENQIHQPVNSHNNIDNYSNNHYSFTEQAEHQLDTPSHNPVAVIEQIPQFVDQYNLDKQSLSNEATAKVSATEASLNKRRMGDESKLILENTPQKRYLVIQEDSNYFLVPHAKIKINEHNISSLEALFECINFTSEYSDFHLVQPAKVSQLESELWQLEEKGKLEFS